MRNKSLLFFSLTLVIVCAFAANNEVKAENVFNPNRILEDHVLLNTKSLSLNEIQSFLSERNSYLASYQTSNAYGELKTAAEIIYDAANNNYDCDNVKLSDNPTEAERQLKCRSITTVSPQFLLVLLQKEQSLIQNPSPSEKALNEATGYGCPTGGYCNPYWKGFGKQVNSAALQFLAYIENPARYNFKVGQTYIAKDKFSMLKSVAKAIEDGSYNSIVSSPGFVSVTIENKATAALYTYTPHIYNGNFNTHRLMNIYFPDSNNSFIPSVPSFKRNFPNGSILKTSNKPEVWLIQAGKKRHFANWSAFVSRFRPGQIVIASDEEIAQYPEGAKIRFANYALVKTPSDKIYLLVDKEKKPFESLSVFKKIGFNEEELESANEDELADYKLGKTISAASTYITGALLENKENGQVYWVENNVKHLVDKALLATKYSDKNITKKTTKELNAFSEGDAVLLDEGTLVMTSSFPKIYLISDNKKMPFASDGSFKALGYNKDNVITVSSQFLYNYPMGETIN